MKLIGLLGGMGWQSTIEYYRLLNELVSQKLGKHHSARLVLSSPDYEDIKQYGYDQAQERGEVLLNALIELSGFNPDCMLICNNTLHKVYDEIKPHLHSDIPVLHIVDIVCEELARKDAKKALLLGTQFTMEDGFFADGLKQQDILSIIPDEDERRHIQEIHDELLQDVPNEKMINWFKELIEKYSDEVDAVVLACTELPLVISQNNVDVPLFNSLELHCKAAVDFALEK